jgi:hypothetical protein
MLGNELAQHALLILAINDERLFKLLAKNKRAKRIAARACEARNDLTDCLNLAGDARVMTNGAYYRLEIL